MRISKILAILFFCGLSSGCVLWNAIRPLSSEEERRLNQYQYNAKQYYDAGRYRQAQQQALRGLAIDSDDESLTSLLGWAHLKLDTRDDIWKAKEYFERIDHKPWFGQENWGILLGHGIALRRQGDFLHAAADEIAKEAKTGSSKMELVKRARKEAKEKYLAATEKLERVLELNPEGTDALDALQQIHALQGNYEKSLTHGKKFADTAKKSRALWIKQLERPNLSSEEEELIRGKIASNRNREAASRSLAATVLFKQKCYEEAILNLNALLALDPERAEEYFNRALCRGEIQNYAGAIEDLETFLKKTPLGFESPPVRRAYDLISQYRNKAGGHKGRSQS